MSRRRELVSHLPEFSRLYAERRGLRGFDRHGSVAPEWVKHRLEAIEREIDSGLEAFSDVNRDQLDAMYREAGDE